MNAKIAPVMILSITALVGAAPDAFAQDDQAALPQEILACAGESDVMLRLSCYDREVAAFRNRPVSSPATVPPVAAVASVPTGVAATTIAETPAVNAADPEPAASAAAPARATNSVDNFGFDTPTAEMRMDEITSEVARIRERPYGELIIYLENGQIWEQKHLDRRFRLKTGESVTITKGAVAGYRLSGDSNRSIQVERLK